MRRVSVLSIVAREEGKKKEKKGRENLGRRGKERKKEKRDDGHPRLFQFCSFGIHERGEEGGKKREKEKTPPTTPSVIGKRGGEERMKLEKE